MRKEVEELKKLNQAFTVYLDKETDNLLKDAKDMEQLRVKKKLKTYF